MGSCKSCYCCSISNGSWRGTYRFVSPLSKSIYVLVDGKLIHRLDDAIEACRTTALDMHSHCESPFLAILKIQAEMLMTR